MGGWAGAAARARACPCVRGGIGLLGGGWDLGWGVLSCPVASPVLPPPSSSSAPHAPRPAQSAPGLLPPLPFSSRRVRRRRPGSKMARGRRLKNGAPPPPRRRGSANAGAHLVGGESRAVVGGESHGVGHLEGAVDEENHDEDVPALLRGRRGGSIPAPQNTLKSRARMRHEVSFCVACAGKQWGDAALVARGSCLKVESGSIGR